MQCVSGVEVCDQYQWITVVKKPRLISPREAFQLQRQYDIMGLAAALTSPLALGLQRRGWKFNRVIRGNEGNAATGPSDGSLSVNHPSEGSPSSEGGFDGSPNEKIIPVGNKWGDLIVFYSDVPI